jgi:hypothetical protein
MAHANLSRRLAGQRLLLHGSSNERRFPNRASAGKDGVWADWKTSSDLDTTVRSPRSNGPRRVHVSSQCQVDRFSRHTPSGWEGRVGSPAIARTSCFPMATARCGVRLHPSVVSAAQPSFILLIGLRSMLLQPHRGVGIPPQCVLHLRQHRNSIRPRCNHGHWRGERPGCLPTDAGPPCFALRNLLNWPPELFVMSGFSWRPREANMRHSRTGRSPGGAHTRPACATTRVKAAKEAC